MIPINTNQSITSSVRNAVQKVCECTRAPIGNIELISFYVATDCLPWLEEKLYNVKKRSEYIENVFYAEMAPSLEFGVTEHSFVYFFYDENEAAWTINIRPLRNHESVQRNIPVPLSTNEEIAAWLQIKGISRY